MFFHHRQGRSYNFFAIFDHRFPNVLKWKCELEKEHDRDTRYIDQPHVQRRSREKKPHPLVVRSKAFFSYHGHNWSSEVAWAKIIYRPNTDTIAFLYRWEQKLTGVDNSWSMPHFPRKSVQRLLEYARRVYYEGHRSSEQPSQPRILRNHRRDDCKRCQELGRPCVKGG